MYAKVFFPYICTPYADILSFILYLSRLFLPSGKMISALSDFLWGWPLILLLMGTHVWLTVRLRFPQRHIFRAIRLSVTPDRDAHGDVSQFGALATALAATIGTGNIVGVATAVALGGPGAVLWCWLTGVFGISTKYAESLLAVHYRVKRRDGHMIGGPMYTLHRGLGMKWLAVFFAVFGMIASFGIGNMVQCNAITFLCRESYGVPLEYMSLAVAFFVALVVLFGVKGIARVCTAFVPMMALLYVVGCLYILCVNGHFVWDALCLIVRSAFTPHAAGGGFAGVTVMLSMRYGVARGLFSNESGMGSAPIVAAAAQTKTPVRQALVSSTGTFWDTVVVCLLTGLVIVSSVLAHDGISFSDGATLTKMAFATIPYVGTPLLTFGIITFAFSTILGWCYYGEKCVQYLGAHTNPLRWSWIYRVVFIVFVYVGGTQRLDLVWSFSDLANGLMAIPNLISLLLLTGVIVSESRRGGVL